MKLKFFDLKQNLTIEETYRELYFAARYCLIENGIYKSRMSVHISMCRRLSKMFNAAKLPSNVHKGKKRKGYENYNKKVKSHNQ